MTSIPDLPQDVIRHILKHCTRHVVHQLLKSKSVAAIAYSILYEEVSLREKYSQFPAGELKPDYTDSEDIDPFEFCGTDLIDNSIDYPGKSGQFCNARELLLFYRTHPLFEPHTLTYLNNSDLAEIEQLKPGFLKKFKYLSYRHMLNDKNVIFDASGYNFNIFTSSEYIKSDQYPTNIQHLIYPANCPDTPMPSLKGLVTHGLESQFSSFDNFPNLQRLKLKSEVSFQLDLPSLLYLSMTAGSADLSKLKKLRTACIILEDSVSVVGYTADCKLRLPENMITLQLEGIQKPEQINLKEGDSLKQLSISFAPSGLSFMNLTAMEYPPNLTRLAVSGSGASEKPEFPKSIEYLTFKGFDLLQPVYPPNLVALNLIDSYSPGTEIKNLKHLVTVRVSNQIIELPPHVKNLQYVEGGFRDSSIINDLKKLENCTINYETPIKYAEISIPSSMKTLKLVSPRLIIDGGANLTYLELERYSCPKRLVLSGMKSLKTLVLSDCVPSSLNDTIELPKMPSSLEFLTLHAQVVNHSFSCPKNLKCLQIVSCSISRSNFSLNDKLESLYMIDVDLKGDSFFKSVGKSLDTLYMNNCRLSTFGADFTATNLQRFQLENSVYNTTKVKFPRCLQTVRLLDVNDDRYLSFLDWADFSLCDQLCEIHCPNTSFESKKNKDRLDKLMAQIPKNINDAGKAPIKSQKSSKPSKASKASSKVEEKKEKSKLSQKIKFWK